MDSNGKIINLRLIVPNDDIHPYYIELNGIRVPIRFSQQTDLVTMLARISVAHDLFINLDWLYKAVDFSVPLGVEYNEELEADVIETFDKVEERKKLFKTILEK